MWFELLTRKQAAALAGCVGFTLVCGFGVWYVDELEKRRRHSSIAKDIAREMWRAEQLSKTGHRLESNGDDGFAAKYMQAAENARDVRLAEESMLELHRSRGK